MVSQFLSVFSYGSRAVSLVWQTSAKFTLMLAVFTVIAGIFLSFIAYVEQLIVGAVVLAAAK